MARQINTTGLNLIRSCEGCRLSAYRDVAGIWTIGYGHTGGVQEGMNISADQAMAFLRQDLGHTESFVYSATSSAPTSDNQFAAMVSLCFNIGSGNFRTSSVLRSHAAQDAAAAADAFLLWDKAHMDGRLEEVEGLLNRRQSERALYLTPDT